jgi:hypothetical protein
MGFSGAVSIKNCQVVFPSLIWVLKTLPGNCKEDPRSIGKRQSGRIVNISISMPIQGKAEAHLHAQAFQRSFHMTQVQSRWGNDHIHLVL